MIELRHGDARLTLDPGPGNIPLWQVLGRDVLHRAPWRDEPEMQALESLAVCEKRLAGDFFCLPFCADDVAGGPLHGASATGPWEVVSQDVSRAALYLRNELYNVDITKEISVLDQVLYSSHTLDGGAGEVSLAHHPMARMQAGGTLSFSPKRAVLTDPKPQYEGRNLWALGQIRPDLSLACEDGSQWDLRRYPAAHAVEDFAILVEARGARLGWTVLMREAEDDMLVVLKDARQLPVTMLWISNGGRDFAPWNGRHTGVIGIEDGIAAGATGLSYSQGENPLRAMEVPTTLTLGPRHVIRHAMISLPRPPGWSEVVAIEEGRDALTLRDISGRDLSVPFDTGFFPA
ncbi:MAG: hypothetical protein AAF825_08475 [Pseudomonadota bacterium]